MSKPKQFDCPSCFAPMVFKGGESLFQNCDTCTAPVIVPDDIYYEKGDLLASVDFASLNNDKDVDVEQVTNALTPGDDLPKATISDWDDAKIEQFDVFQEKIGTGSVAEKNAFDAITSESGEKGLEEETLAERTPHEELTATLDLIRGELSSGDKVEAIKIFRQAFQSDVSSAKDAVEAIERGEALDINVYKDL